MGVERVPLPTAPLGVQRAGDHRSAARQHAFEQALKKRPAPATRVRKAAPSVAAGTTEAEVQVGDDGLPHVDVVV
ncbi:MAG: hypothetical protein R3F56_25710 [Planctomycetota bacterium]